MKKHTFLIVSLHQYHKRSLLIDKNLELRYTNDLNLKKYLTQSVIKNAQSYLKITSSTDVRLISRYFLNFVYCVNGRYLVNLRSIFLIGFWSIFGRLGILAKKLEIVLVINQC